MVPPHGLELLWKLGKKCWKCPVAKHMISQLGKACRNNRKVFRVSVRAPEFENSFFTILENFSKCPVAKHLISELEKSPSEQPQGFSGKRACPRIWKFYFYDNCFLNLERWLKFSFPQPSTLSFGKKQARRGSVRGKRFWNTISDLNHRKELSAAAERRPWASRGAIKLSIAKFRSEVSFEIDLRLLEESLS